MKTFWLILLTFVFYYKVRAQEIGLPDIGEEKIYTSKVETMPEYRGGEEKLYTRLQNIRYLFIDRMQDIQGNVLVSLVVEKDGSVTNVKMVHGLTAEQDDEVVRVVKNLRKWKPGLQDGKPVRVQFTIPIEFKLLKL